MRHLENTGLQDYLSYQVSFFCFFRNRIILLSALFFYVWEPAAQAISPNQKSCICFCAQLSWLLPLHYLKCAHFFLQYFMF